MIPLTYLAFMVRAITGFGSAIFLSPVFSNMLPPKEAVVLIILLESFINLIFLIGERIVIRLKEIYIGAFSGIAAGIIFFGIASQEIIGLLIGSGMAILGLLMLFGFNFRVKNPKGLYVALGFLSGAMGVLTGVNGPQVILGLTNQGYDSAFVRSFMISYLLVIDTVTLVSYLAFGYITPENIGRFAVLAPFVALAYLSGRRILRWLDGETLKKIMLLAVIISSSILIIRYGGDFVGCIFV